MYKKFYGLVEPPFNITPNARFLYLSNRHREALASLFYGIQHRKGFILLTGEIGSGKTTVGRALIRELRNADVRLAVILNSYLTEIELLQTINEEFGLDGSAETKKGLIDVLNRFLVEQHERNTNCVLIIDEAQNLAPEVLEQIRMISNLETETDKMIQIVLMGQPELGPILAQDRLEQLNQRITVRYHLKPLKEREIYHYIRHRLNAAQAKIDIDFSLGALEAIWRYSGGIPRKINVVCDHALMIGYVESSYTIDETMIERAILEVAGSEVQQVGDELRRDARRRYWKTHSWLLKPLAAAAVFLLLFTGIIYGVIAFQGRDRPGGDGLKDLLNPPNENQANRNRPPPEETTFTMTVAPTPPPNDAATTRRFEARPIPVTPEMAWTFDAKGVLRVPRPELARPAAALTVLAHWNIRPDNLNELRRTPPETLAELDVLRLNREIDVRWFDTELPLEKVMGLDVPLILTIAPPPPDAAPEREPLSPRVVLRYAEGEATTIADPLWGEKLLRRGELVKRIASIRIVYFDPVGLHELMRGDEGPRVTALQERLKQLGYYQLGLTGKYGPSTAQAISGLQQFYKLKQTGVLDPITAIYLATRCHKDRPRLFSVGGVPPL